MPYDIPDNTGTMYCDPKDMVSKKTGQPYKLWSGSCKINGVEMWVNAFRNTIKLKDGTSKEVYKMSFNPKTTVMDKKIDEIF